MGGLVDDHRRACDGFAAVADGVADDDWHRPTPCTEWDTSALVEHVIGFHEFLLLRPLGVRAHRPRTGPAARWRATSDALFGLLAQDGALDLVAELPGGGTSRPREMLGALTTDVLVHTWDLARAVGRAPGLDPHTCAATYDAIAEVGLTRGPLIAPAVPVGANADPVSKLVAFYGRDPAWRPA